MKKENTTVGYISPCMHVVSFRACGSVLIGSAHIEPGLDDKVNFNFTHQEGEPGNGVTSLENATGWDDDF